MAPLRELPRRADGTFAPHAGPLRSKQLREEAKRLIRSAAADAEEAEGFGSPRRSRHTPAEEATAGPLSPHSQTGRNRAWQAKSRLEAGPRLDRELEALLDRWDLSGDLEIPILQAAERYGGDAGALTAGLVDFCQQLGEHHVAFEICADVGWLDDQATLETYPELAHVGLLKQLGLPDDAIDDIVDQAHAFDGVPGALLTSAAFLLEENGAGELVDQLADELEVDVDDVLDAVDAAITDGHLDPDDLEGDPSADAPPGSDGVDEEAELQQTYGLSDSDLDMLADFADEHGGTLTDALEAIAGHEGVSLQELAEHAASSGAGDTGQPAGGWDGSAGSDSGDAGGEPAAAAPAT